MEYSPTVLEQIKPEVKAYFQSQGATMYGLKLKTIANAFRVGGWLLETILKPLSKRAADIVRSYSGKIADFLDTVSEVSEAVLASGFRALGMPSDVASALAKIIVALVL
jgi:hypothetical protein